MNALPSLRVLDLTRLLPGPYCTLILADLGADVIKIEEPGGDPARYYPPLQGDTGALFLLVNRNKRSMVLDLKTDTDRERLLRLVERADVLVESFRPGVMERLRLGYDVLAQRNPKLVYASLSGFGQSGPYRDRPGHDVNYLALAGVLGYNADEQGRPFPPAVQLADLGAGSLAAAAILAAVLSCQQTGRGQAVDVSLFASAVSWLPTLMASMGNDSSAPGPGEPMLAGGLPQYGVYATADGRYVALGALEPKFLSNFLEAAGRPELMALARQGSVGRAALRQALKALFAERTLAEWTACLNGVETCFAPVNTLVEAMHDPQANALDLFTSVEHPRLGRVPQLGPPFTFSGMASPIRRPPPDLGEHTREIADEFDLERD